MLGDKIAFGDRAAWQAARAALDDQNEYIDDSHILKDENGCAVGGYYEVLPQSESLSLSVAERIIQRQQYLDETDWYVIRQTETGELMPEEVSKERALAREEISALRMEA